jgi:hypothetical protein
MAESPSFRQVEAEEGPPKNAAGKVSATANKQQIGELALEFMEDLEQTYGDQLEVGTLAIIAEIHLDNGGATAVEFRCSDGRPWLQRGFFEAAIHAVDATAEIIEDDEEE